MEAAGHSNLQTEFSLTHNEETWWLILLWLNWRHISNASQDLGSLRNSDTDVEFPLFYCSRVFASASAPFCLYVFLSLLCPASPYFLVIIVLHISLFTTFSQLRLHLNKISPQTTTSTCLFVTTNSYSPSPIRCMDVESSFTVTSWFAHSVLQVILISFILHMSLFLLF